MTENECKTPIGCLAFIFCQKYISQYKGLQTFLFWWGVFAWGLSQN